VLLLQASQDALAVEDVSALKLKRRAFVQTDAADIVEFGVVQILKPPLLFKWNINNLSGGVIRFGLWFLFFWPTSEAIAAKHKSTALPDAFQTIVKAIAASS
jgi:hypothetical protein